MTVGELRRQLVGVDDSYAVVVNIGGLSQRAARTRLVPLELGSTATTVDGEKQFARVTIPALSIDASAKD